MADIELVIKIDEKMYKDIQSRDWKNGAKWFSEEWRAIHNGTPLPKGHDRLIDAKVAYRKFYARCLAGVAKEVLDLVPTIIEADKDCRECKTEYDCYECEKYEESEKENEN
jgi:hypothetical protein